MPTRFRSSNGFTLLEVLVATVLMAIAVVGLLGNLRTSLANVSRLNDYDRAAILARRQMDALLAQRSLPKGVPIEGLWPVEATGRLPAGWRAMITPYEADVNPGAPLPPGQRFIERIELIVWWGPNEKRRTVKLESFRSGVSTAADTQASERMAVLPGIAP